jgi:predicted negative regulator of RcsB-dependent stress response
VSEHLTRKDLRTDAFTVAVEHNVDYISHHRKQLIQYGGIAVAAILVGVGIYAYMGHAKTVREEQLSEAIAIQETAVTPNGQPGPGVYTTEEAKTAAAAKAFTGVVTAQSGSREGDIAEYYLGCIAADAGKLDEARKHYQLVADSGNKEYASLASYSLAEIDYMQNRAADGEKILRQLIDHPTVFVSKDQASITLARHLGKTNPTEARKLLDPIIRGTSESSQAAVQAMGEIK